MIDKLMGYVILGFVGFVLVAAAITSYTATNTSGWDTNTLALWGIVSIVFIAGFVMMLYKFSK